jgi:cellulose synthase (UDP-forming)
MQRRLDPAMLAPVLRGGMRARYLVLTGFWGACVAWFWLWWLDPTHVASPTGYALSTLALGWIYGLQLYFVAVFLGAKRSAAPDPKPGDFRVAMVVTKTPSEPLSVLIPTLNAMLAQDYPHDTWLADEDPDDLTRAWCARHGVKIATRKGHAHYHNAAWPRRTRCKEGNLAYFYDHWGYRDYDIVAQLDADHVPQTGYLREMVRPFADPAVGYVSAPSICAANAGTSWAARARLQSEAAFHGVFQLGYTGSLAPMCIGSHYAVRTKALQDVGGLGPELAEDHSTSMILNAGGWRGVHAMEAIAIGDGPRTLTDMVTQEFQWSRSLVALLLSHTPRYLRALPWRLRFQFLFCQALYPMMALSAALIYALPIAALWLDQPYADVTYAQFLGHALPTVGAITAFAWAMRRDGFFRPHDARVIAWEKALFLLVQWPWVAWGCLMAVRDRITGRFVDFRITPKGEAAAAPLPYKVIAVYAVLLLGAVSPVLIFGQVSQAAGFYLLSALNGFFYAAILWIAVIGHIRENGQRRAKQPWWREMRPHLGTAGLGAVLLIFAVALRGPESVHALTLGTDLNALTRAEFIVSGAASGSAVGAARIRFVAPDLWTKPLLK